MDRTPDVAARLRAPSWRDPRLAVGVLLVLTSMVLGSWVVTSADRTQPVWAAADTLAPGDAVQGASLTVVQARLDPGLARYLPADGEPPPGLVALRTVAAGEIVPASAVGPAEDLQRRPLGLPVPGTLPEGLVPGAQVDVWVSLPVEPGSPERMPPEQLAAAAEVAEVSTDSGSFAPGSGATAHVLLDDEQLRAALGAMAVDADVAVVLVPGSSPTGGRAR